MYKYETHLHTYPVSRCAVADVRENLQLYKELGYDGVFITNHFLDGNININEPMSYAEKIDFWLSDYEEGVKIGNEIGIKVFLGAELSYNGTDFLVYGPDRKWYLEHPEIMDMKKSDELKFFMESGALVIQAHPFLEEWFFDHIRLFPRSVHGVEVHNAKRSELQNEMARVYAKNYNLIEFAGSDNHKGINQMNFGGMCSEIPIENEKDFVSRVKKGELKTFNFKR